MGLFERVEQRLERAVNGAFARAFRSEVQPVEIASAIRRAMDDRAAVVGHGRTLVPNVFSIELSATDYKRLSGYSDALAGELVAAAQEHADYQRYQPGGPIQVTFAAEEELETGVFRLRTATAKARRAQPSRGRDDRGDRGNRDQRGDSGQRGDSRQQGDREREASAVGWYQQAPVAAPYRPPPGQAAGAPNEPRPRFVNPADRPWLEIDGERYPLVDTITVLGRDNTADIVLDDPGISRRHTEIRVTNDGPHLVTSVRDLGSTNGTWVDGTRISTQRLTDGAQVTVGRTSMTYRAGRR